MVQCINSEATIALWDFYAKAGDERHENVTGGYGVGERNKRERNWLNCQGHIIS